MISDDDAIRENIQYSPFTKRVTTTPQKFESLVKLNISQTKGLSQRAEGVSFI